jgi:hypothetical protein
MPFPFQPGIMGGVDACLAAGRFAARLDAGLKSGSNPKCKGFVAGVAVCIPPLLDPTSKAGGDPVRDGAAKDGHPGGFSI